MGYDTFFEGRFELDRPLMPEHRRVLERLAQEEHTSDEGGKPVRQVGTPRPCIYCQWTPTPDGGGIEWDSGEKFYGWLDWIKYLVNHHLKPWGYVLRGEVRWRGDDLGDAGVI